MNGLAVQPNIVLPTSSMDDWGLQMPNVGAAKKPFLGIYPKTLGQLGSGLKSMAGAIGGAVGTMAHGLISDGYSSGAGNAVGSVGNAVGQLVSNIPGGQLYGGIISAASGVVGGGLNRLIGVKTNEKALAAANEGTSTLKNYHSDADSFDEIQAPETVGNFVNPYKGGLLSKGKARKKNDALRLERTNAIDWAQRDLENNINNISDNQMGNFLRNYAAFGGFLGDDGMGAVNYNFMSDYLLSKKDKNNGTVKPNFTAQTPFGGLGQIGLVGGLGYALGGDIQTHGGDWSNGSVHIDAGGSHEENPYEGVQVGVDSQGVPNLVEEGEVVYNDYVYSNRIEPDEQTRKKFHVSKKARMTFADLAKKLGKESEENPNDPISKRGYDAMMSDLMIEQERQKTELEAQRAREAFEALSPEDQAAVMNMVMNPAPEIQQEVSGGGEVSNPDLAQAVPEQQVVEPAVAAPMVADGSEAMVGAEPQMMAEGGKVNKFPDGGFENWWNQYVVPTDGGTIDYGKLYNSIVGSNDYTNEDEVYQALQRLYNERPDVFRPYDISSYGFVGEPEVTTRIGTEQIPVGTVQSSVVPPQAVAPATTTTPVNPNPLEGSEPVEMKHSATSKLRYIPAIGGALGLMNAVLRSPDYSRAQALINATEGMSTPLMVSPALIGDYVRTDPMDILAQQNRNRQDFRGTDRMIRNGGGNSGSKNAGLLANAYNGIIADNDLYMKALEYNNTNRMKDAEFNRGTNQFNAESIMKAQLANQEATRDAAKQRLSGLSTAYGLMDDIDDRRAKSMSLNLGNLLTSLGNIGEEAYDEDRLKWLERTGVLRSDYYNQSKYGKQGNSSKYGGKLTKKKGGKC